MHCAHTSTPELVTVVADAMGFPRDTLVLFSADCQWMATPWEAIGVKDDLSRLNPQEEVSWGWLTTGTYIRTYLCTIIHML